MKSLLSAFLIAVMIGGFELADTLQLDTAQASTDVTDIPKPSIPEFTLKLVDNSYDVPTTYSTDPYTGQTITHPATHVDNRSIEVTIKNQPFTAISVNEGSSSWLVDFYYNVRVKGHYADDWIALYPPADIPLKPSNSDYTTVSFLITQGYSLEAYNAITDSYDARLNGLPANAQIDFQVEAMIGYVSRTTEFASWHFSGEESGWSNTQTITIPESQTPTPSPAATPTSSPQPASTELTTILGATIIAIALGAGLGLLIYLIKRK
jgi:hypothetical protein